MAIFSVESCGIALWTFLVQLLLLACWLIISTVIWSTKNLGVQPLMGATPHHNVIAEIKQMHQWSRISWSKTQWTRTYLVEFGCGRTLHGRTCSLSGQCHCLLEICKGQYFQFLQLSWISLSSACSKITCYIAYLKLVFINRRLLLLMQSTHKWFKLLLIMSLRKK